MEHGTFSPLVFTTAGGLGPTATVVYKRLASHIAEEHDMEYGKMLHLIRCRLNFSLLRSAIMCLCGSRSATHRPASPLSGTSLTCPVKKTWSPTKTEHFCFYVLDLLIITTLLTHVSFLSQAVCMRAYMYYMLWAYYMRQSDVQQQSLDKH